MIELEQRKDSEIDKYFHNFEIVEILSLLWLLIHLVTHIFPFPFCTKNIVHPNC